MIGDFENDRVERTISTREDKLGPAVCALANDFPNHKQPGYVLLGVKDDGTHKPIFLLKPADEAIGAHSYAVQKSYEDFKSLTRKILEICS